MKTRSSLSTVFWLIAGALSLSARAPGQSSCAQLLAALETFPDVSNQTVGSNVDIDGPWCVAGMPDAWAGRGAVAFWEEDSDGQWQYSQEVRIPGALVSMGFGRDPQLRGDRLLIGTEGALGVNRTAYIYHLRPGGWELEATLEPMTSDANTFGSATAFLDDWAFVGAPYDSVAGANTGSVFIYRRQGTEWLLHQTIQAPVPLVGERFGGVLEAEGDLLVVANLFFGVLTGLDDIYVFRLVGGAWTFEQTLIGSDTDEDDRFGTSFAVQDQTIVVGAKGVNDEPIGTDPGAIYIFEQMAGPGTWAETQRFYFEEGHREFGDQIEFDGARFVVTSKTCALNACETDFHVFEENAGGWIRTNKFVAGMSPYLETAQNQGFRMDADRIVSGHRLVSPSTNSAFYSGRLMVFDLGGIDANGNAVPDRCEDALTPVCSPAVSNSSGSPASIHLLGSPVLQDDLLRLAVTELPQNVLVYMLLADQPGFVPMPGGSQGNLCLSGMIGRYVDEVRNSGFFGRYEIVINPADLPAPLSMILSGEQYTFQAWHRDMNPGPTSNFSDAIAIEFL